MPFLNNGCKIIIKSVLTYDLLYIKINLKMSDYLDPNNEELLKDFFIEAQTQVDTLEQNILVLENEPEDKDAIDEIFRAAHTLKGAAATVQMTELSSFTHIIEDVLDEIRSATIKVTENVIDSLLSSIDITKAMLNARVEGGVYEEDISEVTENLNALLPGSKKKKVETPVPKKKSGPAKKSSANESELSEYDVLELTQAAGGLSVFDVAVFFNEDHPMNTVGGIQVFAALKETGTVLRTEPDFEQLYTDVFYPVVHYYVASDKEENHFSKYTSIPDVVLNTEVIELNKALSHKDADLEGPEEKPKKTDPKRESKTKTQEEPKDKGPEEESVSESSIGEELKKEQAFAAAKTAKESKRPQDIGSVLRVDSRRIDNLLNLVSEAVITKATFNQISNQFSDTMIDLKNTETLFREKLKDLFDSLPVYLENIQKGGSVKSVKKEILDNYGDMFNIISPFENVLKNTVGKFRSTSQNLARTISDLQEGVMQIRMVPISQIFSRFPRLVRDVSKSLNKKVLLQIEGEDTELDKSVIEDLLDPLIHCVRNAVDHGIESPKDRKAAGKDEEGKVLLKASNEGNMIIIEVADDGKGIDVQSVHKKAVEKGLIHPSKQLSDIEAFNLIFEPGFSTAGKVTDISGRGVGLDVVKKQIEKLNGTVSVWSEKGKGSKLIIKLPLTLAIIQGLLIKVGEEIYAIPITSVIDSHRVKLSDIKRIDNYEVFNVREDVISVIRLNRLFKIETDETDSDNRNYFIVIVGSGDKKVGLVIDSLIGEEDVVIKPLKDKYTNSPGIAGATILGDGTVSLIIDVSQLLELGLTREIENRKLREAKIQ